MTNYGTVIDNTLHPAPRAFMLLRGAMVTNPKAEHFAALNEERAKQGMPPFLPVVDERPSTNATNHDVLVAANFTPAPTVHTNGVWQIKGFMIPGSGKAAFPNTRTIRKEAP